MNRKSKSIQQSKNKIYLNSNKNHQQNQYSNRFNEFYQELSETNEKEDPSNNYYNRKEIEEFSYETEYTNKLKKDKINSLFEKNCFKNLPQKDNNTMKLQIQENDKNHLKKILEAKKHSSINAPFGVKEERFLNLYISNTKNNSRSKN